MLFGHSVNRYYFRFAPLYILGISAIFFANYFSLKIPELYRNVINGINLGVIETSSGTVPFNASTLLSEICEPLMLVILIMGFSHTVRHISFYSAGLFVERDLRDRMFRHSTILSQTYYQAHSPGSLMTLFTQDMNTVRGCFGGGIMELFDIFIIGGLALYKMFRLEPMLSLLIMIPVLLLIVIATIVKRSVSARWQKTQESFAALTDFSHETFSGIAVVKAFVKETVRLMSFEKRNDDYKESGLSHLRVSTLMRVLVTLFVESIICIILGYGGYLVYCGSFDAGRLVEFIGYFTAIVWPIQAVSEWLGLAARGKTSFARISTLLDATPDVTDDPEKVIDTPIENGAITVKNLTFRYPMSEQDVLKNISFDILAGEHVGLVGKTGSGKTTLVELLMRVYNVPDQTVYIDGKDMNTLPIHTLRDAIAYVPQDTFLFSDTIAANINFSKGGAVDEEEMLDVSNRAALHEAIADFPSGYQTVLGERGVTVSGGQKQRIAIARALMKPAKIRILDDSVSAVDTATEETILQNLRAEHTTTILIAHRISTITAMDKIVFLENGEVTAVGTHETLYETCPSYRRMVDLQKLNEEEKKAQ